MKCLKMLILFFKRYFETTRETHAQLFWFSVFFVLFCFVLSVLLFVFVFVCLFVCFLFCFCFLFFRLFVCLFLFLFLCFSCGQKDLLQHTLVKITSLVTKTLKHTLKQA